MSVVTVIVPAFNASKYIEMCLASCLSQTYEKIEIVVIDDGSVDETSSIVQGIARSDRRIRYARQQNRGACVARNLGLSMASGQYAIFLDADDELEKDSINLQVQMIDRLGCDEFAVGQSVDLSGDGVIRSRTVHAGTVPHPSAYADLLLDIPVISSAMHRVHNLRKVGGFDPRVEIQQDYDLFVRLLIAGVAPVFHDGVIFRYRQHDSVGRVSRRDPKDIWKSQLAMYERHAEQIRASAQMPIRESLLLGTARCAWRSGRRLVQGGHKDEAAGYFRLSDHIAHGRGVVGRWPYRLAVGAFGPFGGEALMEISKRMIGLIPSFRGASL